MGIHGVELGLLIGAVPTISMSLASLFFTAVHVGPLIEALFQNFAAGLILAAVAAELFPLMVDGVRSSDTWIGVTCGFAVGLTLVFGLESVIEYASEFSFSAETQEEHDEETSSKKSGDATNNGSEHEYIKTKVEVDYGLIHDEVIKRKTSEDEAAAHEDWDDNTIHHAAVALSLPSHREHIKEHLMEILTTIKDMETKCERMGQPTISRRDAELISEDIDEQTHSLQYKLDHTRRLLQGAEANLAGVEETENSLSEEKIIALKHRLHILEETSKHLIDHMQAGHYDLNVLKEMHEHMEDMDHVISSFHDHVAHATSRWARRAREMPETQIGDVVPLNLFIPVTMDCFVDGFLIGVSCSLSPKAGIVLGFANCLEMGFLGMAYSLRLKKCTGSSLLFRMLALYFPPLLMFLAAGFGAFVAFEAQSIPAVFVSFVAFGTVALLALVCMELLIESRETQGEEPVWWVQLSLFAAVYLVLMLEKVI